MFRRFGWLVLGLVFIAASGCSSESDPVNPSGTTSSGMGGSGGGGTGGAGGAGVVGGDRPVKVFVPSSYQQGTPTPLVILLHGYSASGLLQEAYFKLEPLAEARGFLYAHPDGTVDAFDNHFWNATDACCDLQQTGVDDSGYLRSVIDQIKATYTVDEKRVFLAGHSNGGFMSYRMACDHADTIAAIASLAGAMWDDASKCTPSQPVSVLQIHGTMDTVIQYDGGNNLGIPYPSALQSVQDWATLDGCSGTSMAGANLDLENGLAGDETTTQVFMGCDSGGHAELWSIEGGSHIPSLSANFAPQIIDFLFAHPKP